ncbi:ATP-binding protein [Chitinophaga agrisoli]|uniref:ATP-binding protein n=1 Tax=Chitinophaga agrisoli TaxID=2607653 RepID=A0A5B2VN38_9BACT|nr:ATP-binding protein [Chitinophaga agrisoli]KAA2239722.1 ATP-binding protein [Chitinophaga agrisoli]
MIVEFSVGNFRSIKDLQTINLAAASITSKYSETDESNVSKVSDKMSLLKSKAIYGANASGKSNFIKALLAFKILVDRSVKEETTLGLFIEPFYLNETALQLPSFFQLIFVVDGITYRYGFEATRKEITAEWLFGTPGKKEVFFFTREKDKMKVNAAKFPEGSKISDLGGKNGIVRSNALFLTVVRSFNGKLSKRLTDYIMNIAIISGMTDARLYDLAKAALGQDEMREKIAGILKLADTGIEDINVLDLDTGEWAISNPAKSEKNKVILSWHTRYNELNEEVAPVHMLWDVTESDGTKKIFEISPLLLVALEEGYPVFIDEFDARLHPLLTRKILELFNTVNNKNAQLIFVTHDINLLSAKLLRRDQISFVEKDKYGCTSMYSLVDFKGIRNDASFDKDYMQGKYGAIPFLNEFISAFED